MKQLLNALVFKTNKSNYFWVLLVVSASLPVVGALIINLPKKVLDSDKPSNMYNVS